MTIGTVEFDDKNITGFNFQGYSEKSMSSQSIDGTQREKVVINRAYAFNLEISGITKQKTEEFAAMLESLSDSYSNLTIPCEGVVLSELIKYTSANAPSTISVEFDINNVELNNVGGYFDIALNVRLVDYF